jgi:crotonobetainyl-CoA:carnitine CoA-transferase CaiB-like acyl-CoA transferase
MDLLEGVHVLEVSHLWPDSVGQHLADLGADVVRIEHPERGSLSRGLHCFDGLDIPHLVWNRGKRGLALDLKTPDGHQLFLDLARRADIVVEGMRAGTLRKLGLGFDDLRKVNHGIVVVSMTGWGDSGPYRDLPSAGAGFDAYAGLQPAAYREDGLAELPDVVGTRGEGHYAVLVGGLHAALAALAAHVRSRATGEGAHVEVAQADAAVACGFDRLFYLLNGVEGRPTPAALHTRYQYYATKDGKAVFLAPGHPGQWARFCSAVGRADLVDSEPNREAERHEIAELVLTRTRDEWIAFCREHDVSAAPVNAGPEEVLADPQFLDRGLVAEYPDARRGSIKMIGPPVKVEGERFVARPAPEVGEHTDAVLRDFAIPAERIDALRRAGVIK